MVQGLWVIFMLWYFVRGDTDYELYNNDGWIPITYLQAYNPERSDVVQEQYTSEVSTESQNSNDFMQIVTPDNRKGRDFIHLDEDSNEIKHSKRREDSSNGIKSTFTEDDCKNRGKRHYHYYFKIANNIFKPSHHYVIKLSDPNICPDRQTEDEAQSNAILTDMNRVDRSLKILKESTIDQVRDDILNDVIEYQTDDANKEPNKTLDRNYEVTERAESTDTGYVYETPKPNTSNKLNLTNKLLDILARYNIRSDDDNQNYILSRKHKDRSPISSEGVKPFRLETHGYNSLNHLPVDPLLAVFLSHYGHYLPSAYGIRSNYNNAYGYLASNNIHNNKPFGMYKMFSDSDSRY